MSQAEAFESIFGSNRDDGQPLFDQKEKVLAFFIHDVACHLFEANEDSSSDDESDDRNDDNASIVSFEEKLEAMQKNVDRIVELFKQATKARGAFLRNFDKFSPECKKLIQDMIDIADAIHEDNFNSDIAKLVGTLVAALGGIALALTYVTPLAAITVPLSVGGGIACGVGAGVTLGTGVTQFALLKQKMNAVKCVIKQHEKNFSLMAHWFSMPEDLRKMLDSLVSFSVLKEIGEDLKKFFAEISRETGISIGEFKVRFKEMLTFCMKKMTKSGKLHSEFGDVFTPAVMTFIFLVCLMKGKNRIILDCIMINQSLALSLVSILNLTLPAEQLARGLGKGIAELGDDFFRVAFTKFLVALNIAVDVVMVVIHSIEIHKRPEPKQTQEIKKAAKKLEEMFLAIENVYNETKHLQGPKVKWATIVLNNVPDDAEQEDMKIAVRSHLPEKAQDCIKLKRMPTKDNNWYAKVPESHSEQLLQQPHLIIKKKHCEVTHVTK